MLAAWLWAPMDRPSSLGRRQLSHNTAQAYINQNKWNTPKPKQTPKFPTCKQRNPRFLVRNTKLLKEAKIRKGQCLLGCIHAKSHEPEWTLLCSPLSKHDLLALIRAGMMLLSSDFFRPSHAKAGFVLTLLLVWTPRTQMTDEPNLCRIPECTRLLLSFPFCIRSMLFTRQTSSSLKKRYWRTVWKWFKSSLPLFLGSDEYLIELKADKWSFSSSYMVVSSKLAGNPVIIAKLITEVWKFTPVIIKTSFPSYTDIISYELSLVHDLNISCKPAIRAFSSPGEK